MKIYLAGPDVFRTDAKLHGARLKALCTAHGHTGLWPLDNDMFPVSAAAIFNGNAAMVRTCDVILANISPFRGPGMDPGTAWEIGAAHALGKQVLLYTSSFTYYDTRIQSSDIDRTPEFTQIERFGLPENLMIACSGPIFKNAEHAIIAIGVPYDAA